MIFAPNEILSGALSAQAQRKSSATWARVSILLFWPFKIKAANIGQSGVAWILHDMQRVRPTDAPQNTSAITIEAGRGEFVAVQPIVRATVRSLTNVRVSVSAFTGPSTIAAAGNVEVYRESYINVPTSSPGGSKPMSPGWFPDGLIPTNDPGSGNPIPPGAQLRAQNASLGIGKNQPYWVDIYVPRGTSPGDYTGTITVNSDQGSAALSVTLKVWDFELPFKPSLKSSFGMWANNHIRQDYVTVMNHRVQPIAPTQHENALKSNGMYLNNLGYFAHSGRCALSEPPSNSRLQSSVNSHAPGIVLYNYTADEITDCTELDGVIKRWSTALHAVGVKQLITMVPKPSLYGYVDYWPIVPWQYVIYSPNVAAVEAAGAEIWSYTALNQDTYSPKWQIDFSPMNHRIYGFLNHSVGAKGLLYWNIDSWTSDPWTDPYSYSRFPGDGVLVYPGAKVGTSSITPSMRLKYIRAAVQDYEYVKMLKDAGRGEWALPIIRWIAQDWQHWSDNTDQLLQVRHTLGTELDRLARAP